MIIEIAPEGNKMTVDTEQLDEWEFMALFPDVWDAVCAPIARAAGTSLEALRRKGGGEE